LYRFYGRENKLSILKIISRSLPLLCKTKQSEEQSTRKHVTRVLALRLLMRNRGCRQMKLKLKVRHHREEHVGVFVMDFVMDHVVALNWALTTQKKRIQIEWRV
jgi:hypothetical protein